MISSDSTLLQPGLSVAERYRLVQNLGAGGMGTVWRAKERGSDRDVALKFLHASDVSADARMRFEREAKLAARLGDASPHIARVLDHGVFGVARPYVVMELLDGETLSERLRRDRRISVGTAAAIVYQLCHALRIAHDAGVIHRDLKPSNIFLARIERSDRLSVKLLDFGVAKTVEVVEDEEPTAAGTILGTPAYMSPEQIRCRPLDARADLWAVAATVYRALCGRSPFGQGGVPELGLRIIATDPAPPSTLNDTLPRSIDAWMGKGLAKRPEDRFQSAAHLAAALAIAANSDDDIIAPSYASLAAAASTADASEDEPPTQAERTSASTQGRWGAGPGWALERSIR